MKELVQQHLTARLAINNMTVSHSMELAFLGMGLPEMGMRRAMRMEGLGRLVVLSGTVTRTSNVKPELRTAVFSCLKCGLWTPPIVQQYHYTRRCCVGIHDVRINRPNNINWK